MLLGVEVVILLGGLAYAARADLKEREVTDRLWQLMGVIGVALGAVVVSPGGVFPIAIWLIVGMLALQHLFPWDDALGSSLDRYADLIEGVVYVVVVLLVALAASHWGLGPAGVPVGALALLVTILFARALFELGVLYGGADAKALMIAGVLLPVFTSSLLPQSAAVSTLLMVLPYSVNLLMDAAILSLGIPIGIALRNLLRGEFQFPRGFSGYMIPVKELPYRFVWLKDPMTGESSGTELAETSEEDRQDRVRIAEELEAKGVERVWVTPQIPFLVLMALGAVVALLAGNLVLDLLALW